MNPRSSPEPALRLSARHRADTRAAILAATEEVFGEAGLEARMEAIAARAGVAVGTLYNYFRDREALLAALAEARRDALVARLDAAVEAGRGRPLAGALGDLLTALFRHWEAHAPLLARLHEAGQLGRAGPGRHGDPAGEASARVEGLLSRARAGELRAGTDPALAAAGLVGMVRGVALRTLRAGRRPTAADAPAVLDLFLRGAGGRR